MNKDKRQVVLNVTILVLAGLIVIIGIGILSAEDRKVEELEKELEKSNVRFDELRKVADEVTARYNETLGQEQEIQLLKDKVRFLETHLHNQVANLG